MAINDQEKQTTHSCTSTPCRSDSIDHGVDEDAISPQPPLTPGDAHEKPWPRRRTESTIDAEGEDDTALGRLASVTGRTRTRSASNVPPPPDGGTTAWIQVAGGWLVLFTCWGYINSFGSFQSYYTTTALPDHSASAISWIGSVQGFLTTAIGAFAGRMLDAGLFRPTFAVGALLQLAGIFAMSASDSPKYWQLMLTQGILTGLGSGILFTPTIALVATWFGNRRGMAIGLATTGNSVGGIVYPLIVRELIPKVGFAWTVRALGLVNLVCLGTTFLIMRSRLPPRRSGPLVEAKAFTESVYSAYVVGLFFFVWASNYTFYYIGSYGIEALGMSYANASYLIMLVNGAGLPARILLPIVADRIGPLNIIASCCLGFAIILSTWFGVSHVAGLYVFTTFLGMASGATQSLMPTTVASITKRLNTVGTRLGMCFSVCSFASLTVPPIGGALQSAGDYTHAQIWAVVSAIAGAALLVSARIFKVGWVKAKC